MSSPHPEASHVYTLAQHVELRSDGWWNDAVDRTIQYVLFRDRGNVPASNVIRRSIELLGLQRSDVPVIEDRIKALATRGAIIRTGESIAIPLRVADEFDESERRAEELEREVIAKYDEAANHFRPQLLDIPDWETFQTELVFPLVNELGARTLHLLRGDTTLPHTRAHSTFLSRYQDSLRDSAHAMVMRFLDPTSPEVRSFILGRLTHYMLVSSSALDKESLDSLHAASGRPEFHILLDTNVIFSMLNLHYNPSNEAAQAFLQLTQSVKPYADVRIYVLPDTLQEAQDALANALERAPRGTVTTAIADAVTGQGEVSGLLGKYFEARSKKRSLSPQLYFEPFIEGLQIQLEDLGVQVVEFDTSAIRDRRSFKDRVDAWYSFEFDKERGRSRGKIEHDVVALEYVADRRGSGVTAQLTDAKWWFLTVDFGLQNEERRGLQGLRAVPRSINPAELVHVLRFWVPRSEVLESALLGGMRLPFSFFQYDNKTEQTSLKILDRLSRYSNVEDFSPNTVQRLLADKTIRSEFTVASEGSSLTSRPSNTSSQDAAIDKALARVARDLQLETETAKAKIRDLERSARENEIRRTRVDARASGMEQSKAKLVAERDKLERELAKLRRRNDAKELAALSSMQTRVEELENEVGRYREAAYRRTKRIRVAGYWSLMVLLTAASLIGAVTLGRAVEANMWAALLLGLSAVGLSLFAAWMMLYLFRLRESQTHQLVARCLGTWWNWVGAAIVAAIVTFAISPPDK